MSKLEEALAGQLDLLARNENAPWPYGAPVREHHFDWCCEHNKGDHRSAIKRVPKHWYHAGSTPAYCVGCQNKHQNHEYAKGRRWRFDFAWPTAKVAVELDGGTFTGGRHVRGVGFEKDAEKLNAAALQGWLVLRFTQRQVTSGQALESIEAALKERTKESSQ